jgi:hypothetical protein
MDAVYIATVEDTGEKHGERMLGVFKDGDDAHRAVCGFNPWDDDEFKPNWVVTKSFNRMHSSGAEVVILYALDGSKWWKGSVIKYALK